MAYSIPVPRRTETQNEQLFRQAFNTDEAKQREVTFKSPVEKDSEVLDL
jgi:hypothetical protein